ncbi:MAG: LuxR family transcriptional regulator [Herbiconiux sp.]|uniref:LuxR family transcriptional regulator n=1 Tax=Herbiconiux sp. TaxID=1871186 RepID=UPI001203B695|nr:LuxR family transcriptional regulator [Herbiconiux sp.]TAJ48539.1 MAG: LuxR family transcriptional regulator [Herbiconiux sp.]
MGDGGILRRTEVEVAVAALLGGTGVFVLGERGSGRSHFIRAVVARLDEASRRRLLRADGLQQLDEGRAAQFAQAVVQGGRVPLVAALAREPLPRPLARLIDERSAITVHLGPVAAGELLGWTEELIGGPLDPESVAGVVPWRGGADLALFHESVATARRTGALAMAGGVWRLSDGHRAAPQLRDLALSRFHAVQPLSAAREELLELVALAPELAVRSLEEASARLGIRTDVLAEFERLEQTGMIEVLGSAGDLRIRIRDGVVELVLARSMSALRRQRLSGMAVDVLETIPQSLLTPRETIILARYSLMLGRTPDAVLVARAAVASFREPDSGLTRQLAEAAVALAGGFDAEVVLAAAESQLGHSDLALARLEQLVTEAEGDVQRSQSVATLIALVQERVASPAWALDDSRSAAAAGLVDPSAFAHVNATRGLILQALGDTAGAAQLLEPAIGGLEGAALLQAHLAVSHVAMLSGRFARAHEALDAGRAILEQSGQDASGVELSRAVVLSYEGRIPESLALAEAFRASATTFGQWIPQALCTWGIGGLLLSMGCAEEAAVELRAAIALMEKVGTDRTARLVRTDLARALAMGGDAEAARAALDPAVAPSSLDFLDARRRQALAWIAAAENRTADAAADFIRAADTYRANGHELPELTCLSEAARVGSARRVVDRVETISRIAEGDFVAMTVRHVRALAAWEATSGDEELAQEFLAVGSEAARLVVHIEAAEAYATASSILSAVGDAREMAAADRLAAEQLALCGLERSPLRGAHVSAASRLSVRESEIAALAAAGHANREIAAELVLSIRTVETHLLRVYKKLGIRGRSELATALEHPVVDRAPR